MLNVWDFSGCNRNITQENEDLEENHEYVLIIYI